MKTKTPSNRLFIVLLTLFLLPLLNQHFKFIESGVLHGVGPTQNIKFTWRSWWGGDYQKQKEKYINDSIGFRQDLVRIANQLDYWLLLKARTPGLMIGSDHYLYEEDYIYAYCGINYTPEKQNKIREKLYKLRYLQDTLAAMGKQIVLVFEPSKARMYPTHFPGFMHYKKRSPALYEDYIKYCDSFGIQYIDLDKWFVDKRDTSRHLLMSKQGTHWTLYGAYMAADSLTRYMSRVRNIKMSAMVLDSVVTTNIPRSSDDDLAKLLNLVFPFTKEMYSYPVFHYTEDSANAKPNVIYIGDSFIWTLLYNNMPQNTNSAWEYWYYFLEIHDQNSITGAGPMRYIKDTDWISRMKQADCIFIMYSEANLWPLDNKFIDSAYNYFSGNKSIGIQHR